MAYQKQTWNDNPSGNTPITAERLNHIEDGIANAVETDSVARVTNVVSRNLFDLNSISIGGLDDSGEIIDTSSVTINNLDVSQGIINFTANSWRGIASDFIKVENGDTFILNGIFTADNYFHRIVGYDENKTFKSFFDSFYTFPHNINIPDGVSYIKIFLGRGAEAGSINLSSLQLEKGSVATPYTPYLNMQELQEKSNDTGWIDLSSCINTTYFAAREGQPPMARKINGIVYWKGMVYCHTDVGNTIAEILNNLPGWVMPIYENSRGSVQFLTNIPYNIFLDAGSGKIIIIQGQNIVSAGSDHTKAYALTNLSAYPID